MQTLQVDKTWCEEVIISTTLRRGNGIEKDPFRVITQVFLKSGELIAEYDPCNPNNVMAPAFGLGQQLQPLH